MRVLVTGAAGFIGSHLVERLAGDGHVVTAVDCMLNESYPAQIKNSHLQKIGSHPAVTAVTADLRSDDLSGLTAEHDAVVHLAAMPGLSESWSNSGLYIDCNIRATARLLDAVALHPSTKFVQVSTSSVYGKYAVTDESGPTSPVSPYGATKLAAEKLAAAYSDNFGFPLVILRYFSVYGPRQRPDMAYRIFCEALLKGQPIKIFGDGSAIRSNTYVDDVVDATVKAIDSGRDQQIYNICGDDQVSVNEAIGKLESITGKTANMDYQPGRPGDQVRTSGDNARAKRELGWVPQVTLDEGLARQVNWTAEYLGLSL